MAGKKSPITKAFVSDRTLTKWVKRANHWCTTVFKEGVQKQTWSNDKPVV